MMEKGQVRPIAVVTGGNSGMGKATVAGLADRGFETVMVCRSAERGTEAFQELMAVPGRHIHLLFCDLGSLQDVARCAKELKAAFTHLDVLVNNAGVVTLKREETAEGLEMQFGVNHMGHFLLTLELLPLMGPGSRIVNVSSGAHKAGRIHFEDIHLKKRYSLIRAYGQSKLANLLFTLALTERVRDQGILVNACHPGAVSTNMGVDRRTGLGKGIHRILRPFMQTPEEGARTAIHLATSDAVAGVSGAYFIKEAPAMPSKRARDNELANRLFALSEALVREYLKPQREEG